MRRLTRIVACAGVCGLGIAGCGGDEATTVSAPTATTTSPTTTTAAAPSTVTGQAAGQIAVTVAGDSVTGGGRKSVPLGTTVRLEVTADTQDEVHVHGYDRTANVAPRRPATLTFTADVPGIFEVELESRGLKLLDLVVS